MQLGYRTSNYDVLIAGTAIKISKYLNVSIGLAALMRYWNSLGTSPQRKFPMNSKLNQWLGLHAGSWEQ